jgi:aspartate racemase
MKTLALLGGMTYSSTSLYYNAINRHVQARLGTRRSAPLFLYSVDQEVQLTRAMAGEWNEFSEPFCKAAQTFKDGGADAIVICASLAHKAADAVEKIGLPVLHVADFVAKAVQDQGFTRVGIFGSRIVMEDECVKGRLEKKHGLEVLVPGPEERPIINDLVVKELTTGKVSEKTRLYFIKTANDLIDRGAQAIVLGSTDLGFVVTEADVTVPLFETAAIHSKGVAEWAMQDEM